MGEDLPQKGLSPECILLGYRGSRALRAMCPAWEMSHSGTGGCSVWIALISKVSMQSSSSL